MSASGSSFWPSARAEDSESCGNHPDKTDSLNGAIRNWPTATAKDCDSTSGATEAWGHGTTLTDATRTWATPTAMDSEQAGGDVASRGASLNLQATAQWQTPAAADFKRAVNYGRGEGNPTLPEQSKVWQTPATDSFRSRGGDRKDEQGLDQMARNWPTPNAMVANDRESVEAFEERRERVREKHQNGNGMGTPLTIAALSWPTPTSAPDAPNTNSNQVNGPTSLGEAAQIFPTPAARDYRTPNSKAYAERGGGTKGEQLVNFVCHSLPPDLATAAGQECSESTRTSPRRSPQGVSVSGGTTRPDLLKRMRLNPAFVAWLMGWPWWWTRAEPISCAAQEMALFRLRLRAHLSNLCGGH